MLAELENTTGEVVEGIKQAIREKLSALGLFCDVTLKKGIILKKKGSSLDKPYRLPQMGKVFNDNQWGSARYPPPKLSAEEGMVPMKRADLSSKRLGVGSPKPFPNEFYGRSGRQEKVVLGKLENSRGQKREAGPPTLRPKWPFVDQQDSAVDFVEEQAQGSSTWLGKMTLQLLVACIDGVLRPMERTRTYGLYLELQSPPVSRFTLPPEAIPTNGAALICFYIRAQDSERLMPSGQVMALSDASKDFLCKLNGW